MKREDSAANPAVRSDVCRLRLEPYLSYENIALWVLFITSIGMNYTQLLPLVWLGYAMAAAAVGINVLQTRGIRMAIVPFIGLTLLYLFYSYASVLWAYRPEYSLESCNILVRSLVLSWVICILVRTRRQWHWAMCALAVAGLVYGLCYLAFADLGKLAAARLGGQIGKGVGNLPNINVVAMYLAFGGIFFMSELTGKRYQPGWLKITVIILMVASIGLVFLFGSRKSILTVAAGICLYILAASSGMRRLQLAAGAGIVVCLLIAVLPHEYIDFVIGRLFRTFDSSKSLPIEDRFRLRMIDMAYEYISQKPLFGHGFYNFSQLFGRDTGMYFYAHNNILQSLTDLGLIGATIYYSVFAVIIRNWWKTRKTNPSFQLVGIMMTLVILNGFLIVYVLDHFIWCLLALLYVGSRGFRSDGEETRILNRKVIKRPKGKLRRLKT